MLHLRFSRRCFRPDAAGRRAGFTLLGAMPALLAVALLAYIVLSEVGKIRHRAKRAQLAADLKSFAAVFETAYQQKGDWPSATHLESRTPAGLEAALGKTPWLEPTPFGGVYAWVPPPRPTPPPALRTVAINPDEVAVPALRKLPEASKSPPLPGTIAVTAFSPAQPLTLTEDDLRAIDREIDDGNLTTGKFRTGFNGWPIYLVAPRS